MNKEINNLLYDIDAKIVSRVGNGVRGRIHFSCNSPIQLTLEQLADIQRGLGYHPAGYGMFSVTNTATIDKYSYTWQCSTSCD